jgi:hypothetical protein
VCSRIEQSFRLEDAMKKQEVLSLLERFPDLVDSDELIHDLFTEAACDSTASCGAADSERQQNGERAATIRPAASGDATDPFSTRPR